MRNDLDELKKNPEEGRPFYCACYSELQQGDKYAKKFTQHETAITGPPSGQWSDHQLSLSKLPNDYSRDLAHRSAVESSKIQGAGHRSKKLLSLNTCVLFTSLHFTPTPSRVRYQISYMN